MGNQYCSNGGVRDKSISNEERNTKTTSTTTTAATTRETAAETDKITLYIPKYSSIQTCKLLKQVWSREWSKVVQRCKSNPEETRMYSKLWRRTPLHLAMFAGRECTLEVILSLLQVNRHAVILRDKIGYTPLHYACQFNVTYESILLLANSVVQVEHSIINITNSSSSNNMCICFYCVACYYDRSKCTICSNEGHYGKDRHEMDDVINPYPHRSKPKSPLYLACHKNACVEVLEVLLDTAILHKNHLQNRLDSVNINRRQSSSSCVLQPCDCQCMHEISSWIAPLTGGECTHSDSFFPTHPSKNTHIYSTQDRLILNSQQELSSSSSSSSRPPPYVLPSSSSIQEIRNTNTVTQEENNVDVESSTTITTPLEILWNHFTSLNNDHDNSNSITNPDTSLFKLLKHATVEYLNLQNNTSTSCSNQEYNNSNTFPTSTTSQILIKTWKKILLLLIKTAQHHDISSAATTISTASTTQPFLLLHSVVSLKKPILALVSLVLTLFPNDTLVKNKNGYLPLHLAILSYNNKISSISSDETISMHSTIYHNQCQILTMLLKVCPSSVTIPIITTTTINYNTRQQQQQLPLSIAIIKGIEWNPIITEIIQASTIATAAASAFDHPDSTSIVCTKDEIYSLYMFMLAAVNDWNSLNTVYMLLRMFPEVIGY